ncbi:MAG: hypothetical protein ACR2QT_06235 [Woeseiaceae bacterium]
MRMLNRHPPSKQRGAALLIMMLVVMVAAIAVLVTRLNQNDRRVERLGETQDVLAMAKTALIDYAATYPDLNGDFATRLPCPDIDNSGGLLEGEAHTANCGVASESMLGRLPWRTLGIEPLKGGGTACLWYVVSGDYKDAAGFSAAMLNADTNGQIQLYEIDSATIISGVQAEQRPVAAIIAAMPALNGQVRAAAGSNGACSSNYSAANFLDSDLVSGITNANLSGAADTVDLLAVAAGYRPEHNDRIALITRADLARTFSERHDYDTRMRALGLAVAECVANYARSNPGGVDDRRMPWPATLGMPDYRPDAAYDDADIGMISGRLPDIVNDSNLATGNAIGQIMSDCDPVAVTAWTPQMFSLWRNWKDHFFYAVAESHTPSSAVPSNCVSCLTVNGAGQYAAIILFANSRLPSLGQLRNSPPIDTDTKSDPTNYAEAVNASHFPIASGSADFLSQASTNSFNDLLFCVDPILNVTEC